MFYYNTNKKWTPLKATLFHDEINDNLDVASCAQKIASWNTIRSSSDSNSTSDICKAFSPSGLRQFDVVFMVNNIVVRLIRYLPNLG